MARHLDGVDAAGAAESIHLDFRIAPPPAASAATRSTSSGVMAASSLPASRVRSTSKVDPTSSTSRIPRRPRRSPTNAVGAVFEVVGRWALTRIYSGVLVQTNGCALWSPGLRLRIRPEKTRHESYCRDRRRRDHYGSGFQRADNGDPVRPCDWAPQGNGAAAVVLTPKTSSIASPTGRSGSAASG